MNAFLLLLRQTLKTLGLAEIMLVCLIFPFGSTVKGFFCPTGAAWLLSSSLCAASADVAHSPAVSAAVVAGSAAEKAAAARRERESRQRYEPCSQRLRFADCDVTWR